MSGYSPQGQYLPGYPPTAQYAPGYPPSVPYGPGYPPQVQFAPGPSPQGQYMSGPPIQGQYVPGPTPQGQYMPGPHLQGHYVPGSTPQGQYPHTQQGQNVSGPHPQGQHGPGHHPPEQYVPGRPAQGQPGPTYNSSGVLFPWNPKQAKAKSYDGIDKATKDANENDAEENASAPAPRYELQIAGYSAVTSGGSATSNPPKISEDVKKVAANIEASRMPGLAEEDAREALLGLVAQNCCWGKKAAKNMKVNDIITMCAYHYNLETYTEDRSYCSTFVPFKGGQIDGPENGPARVPWDIPCKAKAFFKDESRKIKVAHTEVARPCHLCCGRGFNRCGKCRGRGMVKCAACEGKGKKEVTKEDGTKHKINCDLCNKNGRKKCPKCQSSGCELCSACAGYGSVKQYIQLTVNFKNHHHDHVVERSDLPSHLIKGVHGDTIFSQTHHRVGPIQNFIDREINDKSKEMVNNHSSWPSKRILQQRHYLRAVPVHECHFVFKEKPGRYWVYGNQRKVHTNDYPHTCCCCRCAIL